jgi:hypothetical protein
VCASRGIVDVACPPDCHVVGPLESGALFDVVELLARQVGINAMVLLKVLKGPLGRIGAPKRVARDPLHGLVVYDYRRQSSGVRVETGDAKVVDLARPVIVTDPRDRNSSFAPQKAVARYQAARLNPTASLTSLAAESVRLHSPRKIRALHHPKRVVSSCHNALVADSDRDEISRILMGKMRFDLMKHPRARSCVE